VPLQNSFRALRDHLRELREVLEALSTTVEEDRPRRKDVVVASSLSDAILAVRGFLEESWAAADEACEAVGRTLDLDRARRALIACQERFIALPPSFLTTLPPMSGWQTSPASRGSADGTGRAGSKW
jgi:hypothetical protein